MHSNNSINSDITCYINSNIATSKQVCSELCEVHAKTILIIYFPIGFIVLSIIIFKIVERIYKKKNIHSETKEIGLQCEFSILHQVVIEPDNSLSIVCESS